MYQKNINSPDCEPSFIGLVVRPHDGLFNFTDMKKKCKICGKTKPITEFYKGYGQYGYLNECKKCSLEKCKNYQRTKKGFVTIMYNSQINSSKRRHYPLPTYTKQELKDWLFSQPKFHELFDNWVKSGYKRDLVPSVDRKDDYKSYTMDNIQLMTWEENNIKGRIDRIIGRNNKKSKAILQFDMNGNFIKEYYSIMQAERETKIHHPNISKVCLGKRSYAGNFIWKYKN